jgi:uncharacterized protein (DUF1697 family)
MCGTATESAFVPTFIALIRGINVGKAKRIAMADLRKLVEKLGFGDVRTLLNSGNVIFTSRKASPGDAAARIEKAMLECTGVSARVVVVTAEEIAAAVAENPLLKIAVNPSRFLVAVLGDPADCAKLKPLLKEKWGKEKLAVGTRVAYLWCADGILESKLAAAVSKALNNALTARNWATILKLLAMTQAK